MKKRIIAVILSVLMLLSIAPLTSVSALMMGDVDGDGKLSAADARAVLRASVNLETLDAEAFKAADVDGDGKLSAADARSVLRASVNLESLHTHSFAGTVTTAATCETAGVMTYSCECGKDSYTEVIPATGHTVAADAAVAPTCTVAGKTAGTHCSVCNAVITAQNTVPATGHVRSTVDASTVKAVTCKEDGYTGDKRCDVCGVITEYGSVIPHTGDTHNMKETYVAPSCEAGGYFVTKCTECAHFDSKSVRYDGTDPKQHTYPNDGAYRTIAPTCDEMGYKTRTCSVCTFEDNIDFTDATGHKFLPKATETKDATCQENGYKKYDCKNAGCNYVRTDVIDTVACNTSVQTVVAGTKKIGDVEGHSCCTEYKCSWCNNVVSVVENYGAHSMLQKSYTEVSCTTPEARTMACEYCDFENAVYTKEAPGHSCSTVKQPTCTEDGFIDTSGVCENPGCGDTVTGEHIVLPKKGHQLTGVRTCETSVTCTVCKEVVQEKYGHNYEIESTAITMQGRDKTVDTFFCTRCGKAKESKEDKLETFNAVVNKIKTDFYPSYYDKLHYFGKIHTETSYTEFNFGIYTSMIRDMYEEDMANNPDTYLPIRTAFSVQTILPVENSNVSELTASDVDSVTVERLSGVQFNNVLSGFDTKYSIKNNKGEVIGNYDLTDYKAIKETDSVIKVTVDVRNEDFYKDIYPLAGESKTSLQKIFEYDLESEYKGFTMDKSNNKLYFEESEKNDGYEMTMKMYLDSLTTDGKVVYYFLEETYQPIIAVYDAYQTMSQDIDMRFKIGLTINGKMSPVIKTQNTTVFVFPDYLPEQ